MRIMLALLPLMLILGEKGGAYGQGLAAGVYKYCAHPEMWPCAVNLSFSKFLLGTLLAAGLI